MKKGIRNISKKSSISLILIVLFIIVSAFSGCLGFFNDSCNFKQQLNAEGSGGNRYNTVVFPECVFPDSGKIEVEKAISSIIGTGGDVNIFTNSDPDFGVCAWFETKEINELIFIYPDVEYYFYVEYGCVLKLKGN